MLETDDEFANLRKQIDRVAERGVCQNARYHEYDARGHQTRGAKKYPSGKELVLVLNTTVRVAYLHGEFHRQDDYDNTSTIHTIDGLEDGNRATRDGSSGNIPPSPCEMQDEECISL